MDYPLASSTWNRLELKAIKKVLKSGQFTMGKLTAEFEFEFARWHGVRNAIMVNSGSSANLLAVAAIKYSNFGKQVKNPEVIVPAVSWITTYSPLAQLGYRLKVVDVSGSDFNIDTSEILSAISPSTVGIVGVNLLGSPANWIEIKKIANENDLWCLEDNCESMGAKIQEIYSGNFGDISTFSFFFSHHICTMEGGMILCNDDELALYIRSMRSHGWSRNLNFSGKFLDTYTTNEWEEKFRFYLPGFNLRPTEISAAVGIIQLKKFPTFLTKRRKNYETLISYLGEIETNWELQKTLYSSSWFTFGFVPKKNVEVDRYSIIERFKRYDIESRPIVAGNIMRHPVSKYLCTETKSDLTNANIIHDYGFMVGNSSENLQKQLVRLVEVLSVKK